MMRLYGYFRSSAAYRCRIALNLKGLDYELDVVHLLKNGGQQHSLAYKRLNPQGLVPALDVDGEVLIQSLAIIEYLEEMHPKPALLPADPVMRARVRGFAEAIACDIHPLNNLRVLNYLRDEMGQDEAARQAWYRHWIETGFAACEQLLERAPRGRFCFGDSPSLADVCLVPQIFNARRFECDLSGCPRLVEIDAACMELPAFEKAAPGNQPDAR